MSDHFHDDNCPRCRRMDAALDECMNAAAQLLAQDGDKIDPREFSAVMLKGAMLAFVWYCFDVEDGVANLITAIESARRDPELMIELGEYLSKFDNAGIRHEEYL